jgi:hypothetical protein
LIRWLTVFGGTDGTAGKVLKLLSKRHNIAVSEWSGPLKQIDFKEASGMIKLLTGSCLSGLGIVLKEPSVI